MIDSILNYRTDNLIILYYYIYSGLADTMGDIVWNSIRLIRSIRFGSQVDKWLE